MREIDAVAHYCFSHGTPQLLLIMELEIKTSWKVGTARVVTRFRAMMYSVESVAIWRQNTSECDICVT